MAGLWVVCSPRIDRLPVDFGGCDEFLRAGPVCVVRRDANGPRRLKLWVEPPAEAAALDFLADGRRVRRFPAAEGLLEPEIPPNTRRIGLRAETPSGFAVWSLAVAQPVPRPSWFREALAAKDDPARKQEILRREIPRVSDPELRRAALDALARSLDGADRDDLLAEGVKDHRAAGRLRGEVWDATALAHYEIDNFRLTDSRQLLEDLHLPELVPAEVEVVVAFERSRLARWSGDLREGLRSPPQRAARLIPKQWRDWIAQTQGIALQSLGRWQEAKAIFAALRRDWEGEKPPVDPCDLAQLLTNEGWLLLMRRESGEADEAPVPVLAQAEKLWNECPDTARVGERFNARLNMALAFLDENDLPQARAALGEAGRFAATAKPQHRLWQLELEGRLALLAGQGREALARYDRMARLAEKIASPDGLWQAAYGRARAYEALGDVEAALAAYREAERQIDEQSLAIALAEGRETFMELRQAGTRAYLNLLVKSAPARDAFTAARHARARLLRQLERADPLALLPPAKREEWEKALATYQAGQKELNSEAGDEWKLPEAERRRAREKRAALARELEATLDRAFAALDHGDKALVPPAADEVILAYERLGKERWVGFAADARGVEVATIALPEGDSLPSPAELARLLLAPFADALGRARRVRVLASGRLEQVDFHALPFAGDILLASRLVTYGLDLPRRSGAAPGSSRRALVVADPLGNLPAARREARDVEAALRRAAWRVDTLAGHAADAAAVTGALHQVDLLHYAGHATVLGATGWESELPLAGGAPLSVRDLLAAPRVPAWVVLSACETGRTTADTSVATLGLAHAFLLAGARGVVATARPVADLTAAKLSAELYRGFRDQADLPALLRQAQLALRRDAIPGWQSFRLYEP